MADILDLTRHLPEHTFEPGETIISEGSDGSAIWILVEGALQVRKGDVPVVQLDHPGAVIGEMSVLLGGRHTATVVAVQPTRLRLAADGHALLGSDPAVTRIVAVGLAERLAFVTTYLSNLKHQYGDAPGLAMVDDVLRRLAQRQGPRAVPGSARDSEPLY
jgi:CRP/FNR family transcriptional regulator, cyclic AMP receptor protein